MEGQAVLGAKLLVTVDGVDADAQDHGVLGIELRQCVWNLCASMVQPLVMSLG